MEKTGARVLAQPIDMHTGKLLQGSALEKWQKTSGGFKFIETDEDLKRGFQINGNDVQLGDKMPSAMWVRKKKNPPSRSGSRSTIASSSQVGLHPGARRRRRPLAGAISTIAGGGSATPTPPKKSRTATLLAAFCKKKGYKLVSPRNIRLKLWRVWSARSSSPPNMRNERLTYSPSWRGHAYTSHVEAVVQNSLRRRIWHSKSEKAKESGRSMWQLFNIAQGGKKKDGMRRSFKLVGDKGFVSHYKMEHAVFRGVDKHPFVFQVHNSLNNVLGSSSNQQPKKSTMRWRTTSNSLATSATSEPLCITTMGRSKTPTQNIKK